MRGINGIYKFGFETVQETRLAKMNKSLESRGVSESKVFQNIGIAQLGGHYAESTDGRYTAVLNGSILNKSSLRSKLADSNFKTDSDNEILIASFVKWGVEMVQHLEGMFSFAITDSRENELFIARDRFGMIPLYYYLDENIFIFSSEIKGLLASEFFKPVFAKDRLPEFFRFGTIMEENTFLRNVKNFPPANSAHFSNFIFDFNPYWQAESSLQIEDTYEQSKKKIRELFFDSVSTSLVSDSKSGIFLSGGIDSTAITAAASESSIGQVRTININFDESEFSEAYYAKIVSKKFNTKHEELRLKPSVFLEEIDNILSAYSFPSMDGANTYIVSQVAKKIGIEIGYSGLGGDELFCGYPVFSKIQPAYRNLKIMPDFAKKIIIKYLQKNPDMRKKKMIDMLSMSKPDVANIYGIFRSLMSVNDCKNMANGYRTVINSQKHFKGKGSFLSELSVAEFNYYMMPVLLRDTEQMSVRNSIEIRSPFLDSKLVDYVLGLPDAYKTKTKLPKSLLVASLSDLMPMEIVDRKKMGFVLPWEKWLKNELSHYVQDSINSLKDTDLLNYNSWQTAFDEFKSGKSGYNWNIFWGLVVLTNWMKLNKL